MEDMMATSHKAKIPGPLGHKQYKRHRFAYTAKMPEESAPSQRRAPAGSEASRSARVFERDRPSRARRPNRFIGTIQAECLEVMTDIGSDREFLLFLDEGTIGRIALQLGFGGKRTGKPAAADSVVHAYGEPNVLDTARRIVDGIA
jgi:hypothetical protein